MSIECILFDCDGTLVDSEMLAARAYQLIFRSLGIELDALILHDNYKGMKIYDILAQITHEHHIKKDPLLLEKAFRAELTQLMEEELTAIPGVVELVSHLKVPVAVVSNGPLSKIKQSMQLTGLDKWFGNNLFSAFDIGRWKPDPELILACCEKLGVNPANTLLIDDSVSGVKAGINAGIQVWYFTEHPDESILPHPLVKVFSHMSQLPELWIREGVNVF